MALKLLLQYDLRVMISQIWKYFIFWTPEIWNSLPQKKANSNLETGKLPLSTLQNLAPWCRVYKLKPQVNVFIQVHSSLATGILEISFVSMSRYICDLFGCFVIVKDVLTFYVSFNLLTYKLAYFSFVDVIIARFL